MARRGIRHKRIQQEDQPAVNLTPLVDVVFSILIMFIVIAPMLNLDQVDLAAGPSESMDADISLRESGPIAIHVHKDNTIWVNKKLIDSLHLPELLKREKQRNPEATPRLFHDRRAQFGTYQTVKNALEAAGFKQLDVILKPA